MSTQVQYRRGTATENNAFTGALAEITVDTTNWTLRVQDGATAGGYTLASLTATQTLTNKTLSSPTFTGSATGTANITLTGNIGATNLNITGNIVDTGAISIITAASGNVNLAPNGTNVIVATTTGANVTGTLTATGNVTGSNLVTAGLLSINSGNSSGTVITNAGGNGVGNIGSETGYFNTAHVKATSAQYADVAEKYVADQNYEPGTVVEIGGLAEVTATTQPRSTKIAGVVSTNPAFVMNSCETNPNAVDVALLGRVPCRVVGTINKGDILCSSHIPGVATADSMPTYGSIVGKALEQYNSNEVGTIEVLVGRL
jgi:hypothetical protein